MAEKLTLQEEMPKEGWYQGPAAAVIPAPIAYIKVVAVKQLVVEFWAGLGGLAARRVLLWPGLSFWGTMMLLIGCYGDPGLLL